ncbi:maleylpyruvate isomerase N-terminal domain-containing protein [Streptomyces sp. NPDC006476]|uniref:maleylpyruvate isomerase N-terminal domain-containing protein n=1 Tax=Streptomyces sp. NPDC006476 TaxID=3157175 RepID=UPI0033BDA43F
MPTCPGWTLSDLVQHIGEGRRRWAATVAAGPDATSRTPAQVTRSRRRSAKPCRPGWPPRPSCCRRPCGRPVRTRAASPAEATRRRRTPPVASPGTRSRRSRCTPTTPSSPWASRSHCRSRWPLLA